MKQTIIEGYLTQEKLETILKNEDSFNFEKAESPVPDSKLRFDFLLTDKKTNQKIAVEFNGYQHYTKSKAILNDRLKAEICKKHKIKLVEIPYFVQLNNQTFKHFFKREPSTKIVQDYPHGFIDKKAILPADFCSLGIQRYIEDYLKLPKKIQQKIDESLLDKIYCELRSPEEIFPLDLIYDEIWELYQQVWEDYNKEILKNINEEFAKELKKSK